MDEPSSPAGWYVDPARSSELRWWDGRAWTAHTTPRWLPPAGSGGAWPWILGGGVALAAGVLVGGLALFVVGGQHSDSSDLGGSSTQTPVPVPVAPVPPPRSSYREPGSHRLRLVSLGQPVELVDQDGAKVRVTMRSIVTLHPHRGSLVTQPRPGSRIVGLRLRLQAVGSRGYSDDAYNATRVFVAGRAYRPLDDEYDGCPELPIDLTLRRGHSIYGCLSFEVPKAPAPKKIRYWPSSQFGPDVGYWRPR